MFCSQLLPFVWNPVLEFGHFRLDPDQHLLWRDGRLLKVGPLVVRTLAVLAGHLNDVVSKEELIRQVWGDDTFVGENSLARNVLALRKLLQEDPAAGFTIENVPKRGYRLCGVSTSRTEPERSSLTSLCQGRS
jgi:DNA-binding winged helix-turn-helix (wHTH) protein